MSLYSTHCEKWKPKGCGATICAGASKVVIARGTVPCEVLFVGEAPGPSENVLGIPFCGPAGHLLDKIIADAFDQWQVPGTSGAGYNSVTWAFTNLVSCIPLDDGGVKFSDPDEDSILSCQPRLTEFVDTVARPKLIVAVGALAKKWLDPGYMCSMKFECRPYVSHVDHPAFILRADISRRGLLIQRAIVSISEAYERFVFGR